MDWMQFVSALVSALAWPAAVVTVVCLLKNPILGLIPKIRSFKYGELHVDLTEQLKSLQDDLPAQPAKPDAKPDAPRLEISIPIQIAAVSTRAGVIAAWLEVEEALNNVAKLHGLDTHRGRPAPARIKMDGLRAAGIVDQKTYDLFSRTSELRNEALHMPDREITYDDAVAMADVCKWLVEKFKTLK